MTVTQEGWWKPLNLKASPELRDLVERAARAAGARNKSDWMRQALEAGARAELAAEERRAREAMKPRKPVQTIARGFVEVQGVRRPSGCQHPSTARVDTPEAESCGLCGVVTRWK